MRDRIMINIYHGSTYSNGQIHLDDFVKLPKRWESMNDEQKKEWITKNELKIEKAIKSAISITIEPSLI